MTSFRTAGSDMPLTSPSEALSALLNPANRGCRPGASPVPPRRAPPAPRRHRPPPATAATRAWFRSRTRSQRSTELAGRGDRCDSQLAQPVHRVLQRDHDLGIVLESRGFARERLGGTEGNVEAITRSCLPGRTGSPTNGCLATYWMP